VLALVSTSVAARQSPVQAAQPKVVAEPVVTAAILISFAKFTEWPADVLAPDARLVVCVTDPLVAAALSAMPAQTVGTHPVSVSVVTPEPAPRACSLLYVSGLAPRRLSTLAGALRNVSVLSIADSEEFTKSGGVVRLYVADGRMRFSVNVTAAERARLRLSSKMLALATIIVKE
jgi:hypothetical protein